MIKSMVAACALALGLCVAAVAPAHAEDWTGEGAISAGLNTGNTETSDVGVALKGAFEGDLWRHSAQLAYDYAEQDDEESKNRVFGAYQLDRNLSEQLFVFGRATHEQDKFSGFSNRTLVALGAGYHIIQGEPTSWTVQAGPGFRRDKIRAVDPTATTPAVAGSTEEGFAFLAGSRIKHAFNDAVALSNDTDVVYAEVSTQIVNELALTAKLTEALSGRVSFGVRYETDPPEGSEDTDTATRFGLVYAF